MMPDPLMLSDRPDLKLNYDDLEALRVAATTDDATRPSTERAT